MMEAKDTVKPCGDEHCQPYCHEAQAEITWDKAIREVVEWMKAKMELTRCDPDTMAYFQDYVWVDYTEWQAKLKEWGL